MFLFLRDGGGFCYKMFCTLIEALDNIGLYWWCESYGRYWSVWLLVWAGCLVSIRFSCNCGVKEGDFAGAFCLHGEVNGRCCLHSISRSCVLCLFVNWSLVLEVGRSQYKVQEVCDLTTWVGQDCFQWWYIIPTRYSLYLFHHFLPWIFSSDLIL